MKNYLKKLLVGILVAALSVTGIDYVPVMADLAAGDNILADYDSTMADTEQWGYNNAWVSQNSDMGFSTANFANNGGPFYGAVGNEAAIYTKTEFELNPGTYTINFKGYAEGTDAFPYVNGKVDTSYVSLSGSWKNPKAEALTFTVSEKTTAKVGLFFVASTGEGWFNVSDISIVYTSDEVPAEYEFYVGFDGNLTDNTKMTSEGSGKYTYKCGAVTEGNVEFGVYSSTSWNDGVVGWANYTIYSDGYGEIVYTTADNKVVYNVYSDSDYTDLIENTSVAPDFYFGYPDNLKPMVKVSDNEYTYEYGAVSAGTEFGHGIYGSTGSWNDVVVAWSNFNVPADGFLKAFYDSSENTITLKVFTDDTYTTEVTVNNDKDYYIAVGGHAESLVLMDKEDDGTYSYKLGLIESEETNWITVAEDSLWNGEVAFGNKTIPTGYVKLVFNPSGNKLSIKVYSDAEYTQEIVDEKYFVGFDGNLTANTQMTDEGDGKFTYKCGAVTEGNVEFGVYSSTSWNDSVVGWANYIIYSDGYGEIVYTTADNKVVYNVYSDSNYTDLIENNAEVPDFYFGVTGALKAMTKVSEGNYSYEYGQVAAGDVLGNGIYGSTGSWNDVVVEWANYEIPANGYLKVFYDSVGKVVSYKIYEDDTYTNEVKVENKKATIYVYYPGDKDVKNDTLTIAFAKGAVASSQDADKLGKAYGETYWNRVCYPLKKVKENWYSFDVYKDFGGFQIVANPHSEVYPTNSADNENTTWLIDFGYYGDVNTDDKDNVRYNTLFEKEVAYVMYNTLFDSIEAAESYDKAFGWDYYIAGSTNDFEPKCDKGIFSNYWAQDNYRFVESENRYTGDANWLDQMTKSKDGKKLTWVSTTKAKKFETYALNVYADKSWFGKVWKNNFSFLAVADSYVKVTYDLVNSKFSVEYFDDAECKDATEFDEITIYYYYGVTGAKDLYLAFNTEIPGKKATKKYWGRYCYPMTEAGNGWYVFKGYKAIYGGYQVVVNPQNEDFGKGDKEDKEGTIWQTDIGDYGDISTSDSDLSRFKAFLSAGNKAYIKYNKVFKTQNAADSFTNWTYYVAGSTTAYTNTNSGKGIFSNYWAGDFVNGVDEEGKVYEKKEDTWPDVFTKEKENVYSVKLGKALKGTTYAFNVYTEKDWNATNLSGSMGAANPQFKATSNNYVKLYFYRDLKKGKNTWAVEYYTDKDCKVKAKLSAPSKLKVKSLKATKGAKVKLTWKAVDGATSYAIYANGKKVAGTTKNSKVLKYKKAGKTIKYTVVARSKEYANSNASKALKVKTPGKITKAKAKGLKNGIKVTWKKVKKSNGYVVYRSTKKKKGFKKIATLKGAKKTKFLDKKAVKGKKYFYKVFSFRKNGKKVKVYSNSSKLKSAKRK